MRCRPVKRFLEAFMYLYTVHYRKPDGSVYALQVKAANKQQAVQIAVERGIILTWIFAVDKWEGFND